MPSTTAEARPRLQVIGEDAADPRLLRGLEVLLALVRQSARPTSVQQEEDALHAIETLHHKAVPGSPAQEPRKELKRWIENAGPAQVECLVRWLERGAGEVTGRLPRARRRRARHLLLLVLLAKALGSRGDHEVLGHLNRLGYWGDAGKLDSLLRGTIGRFPLPAARRLAADYLLRVMSLVFDDASLVSPPGAVTETQFRSWSWSIRMLHLVAWRHMWNRRVDAQDQADNPVLHAETMEFRLAASRAFSALASDGGPFARHLLRVLDYRDAAVRRRPWPWKGLLAAAVMACACAAAAAWCASRARAFDESVARFARSVELTCTTDLSRPLFPSMEDAVGKEKE